MLNKQKFDWLILACFFVAFVSVALVRHSPDVTNTLSSDTRGYYMYLPAIFQYGGIHHVADSNFVGRIVNENGEVYTKFTSGVAWCYLPSFLVARAYANYAHIGPSCYTYPYCYALIIGAVCWAVSGLYLLKTLLLRYFSRGVAWLTVFCIALGTNFYCYATLDVGMSHIYSFTLFAAVLLLLDDYYRHPALMRLIAISFLLGWIVLIRPTNILFFLFIFLYRVNNPAAIRERSVFIKGHIQHIVLSFPFFFILIIPQLLYWRAMTGHLLSYSYGDEHFLYWRNPKIAAVLFDTQNGWLLYSPVLLFLFWGLFAKPKDMRISFPGTLIVLAAAIYVFASWHAWWFGGAFGHRCFIDYYPILAFPLALTLEMLLTNRKVLKFSLLTLIFILCYYNVGMTSIYLTHGIWDGPSWRWNYDKWWDLVRMAFFLPV